jgi:hypothetical protein
MVNIGGCKLPVEMVSRLGGSTMFRYGCSRLFSYLSTDGGTMLIGGQQQHFLFLETIVEETSDDLRSDSDRSGPAGWPDSDSDTESVIHVPNSLGMWHLLRRDIC